MLLATADFAEECFSSRKLLRDIVEFMLFFLSNELSILPDGSGDFDLCLLAADDEEEVLISPCLDRLRLRCDSIRTEAGVPDRANVRFHRASLSSPPPPMELLRLLEVLPMR